MFTFPITLFATSNTATLTFLQSETVQIASQSSYTFTVANIGPAASDRYVVVCISSEASTDGRTLSSVTIGGNAATLHANAASNIVASTTVIAAIAGLLVTSGTTATVVANFSGNMAICYCHVYTLTFDLSSTPTATKTKASNAATTSLSDTINVPENGALLVTSCCATSTGSYTMTGVAEDADLNSGNVPSCVGSQDQLSAETGRAYSVTISANTPNMAMAAVVWH